MKRIIPLLIVLALMTQVLTFSACDDDTSLIGSGIMPGKDNVSTNDTIFRIYSRSIQVDSVLANTTNSYLGCIVDLSLIHI